MARAPVRTILIIVAVVALAVLLRWIGGGWLLSQLRSLHGSNAENVELRA